MLGLLGEIEAAYYSDLGLENAEDDQTRIPFADYRSTNAPDGLVIAYARLEKLRIDDSLGDNTSNESDIKRMAALNAIAELGTEDEQLLHQLISRHETVQNEITQLHKKCSLYVSSHNYAIKRENIEELYLYLKEKVRSGVEISTEMTDEMHELVYHTTVSNSPELAMEVLGLLLELNILEDEEIMLRGRIQDIVGASPSKANARAAEAESLAEPASLFGGFEAIDPSLEQSESKGAESKDTAERKEETSSSSSLAADAKLQGDGNRENDGSKANTGANNKVNAAVNNEEFVNALKQQHLTSLTTLKDRLKSEKDRRLQELEDRLMRRKLARKKLLAAEGGVASKDDLEGDEEIEKQITDTHTQMDKLEEGLIGGLKKKCLFEMKTLKAKDEVAPLSDEDKREANRLASQELIKRYERDQKNLLASLEAQRLIKQKNKILMRAKAQAAKNKSTGDGVDAEVEEELRQVDVYFKDEITNALLAPQSNLLLALSCINDYDTEAKGTQKNTDDEDDYMDDDKKGSGDGQGDIRAWLEGVEEKKSKYEIAGKALQYKLIDAHYNEQGVLPSADGEYGSTFVDLSGHMLKVITTAFSKHESETEDADYKYGHGKKKRGDQEDRIKAGILEEFEASRDAYADILNSKQAASKDKLAARRKKNDAKGSADDAKDDSTSTLTSTIESFLEDPIRTVVATPMKKKPAAGDGLAPVHATPIKESEAVKSNNASAVKEFNKPKVLPPIGSMSAMKAPGALPPIANGDTLANATELRQKHMEKEKTLMDTLQTQMVQKKRLLDDRLKRKKDQRVKTEQLQSESGIENARVAIAQQEEEIAQSELNKLQEAFDSIARMIKESPSSDIVRVDMEGMMALLDKSIRGEKIHELPLFPVDENTSTSDKILGFGGTDLQQQQTNKILMQDEVNRISSNYNEEKQKFDLAMKMEQARQRSNLQKKLLAKKQQQTGSVGHKSAGYPGDGKVNFANFNLSDSGAEGAVYAGADDNAFRVPKSLAHGLSSRGMNLAPITRK